MANQRYFIKCPCGKAEYFGKSLGDGIYQRSLKDSTHLNRIYDWMWEHMVNCHGDGEFTSGKLFTILSEDATFNSLKRSWIRKIRKWLRSISLTH